MPSSYTQSLRLILPVTGELTGTWGDAVNAGLTELVEDAIAGTAAIAMANANVTLTTANEAADQARNMFLNLTGANTAQRDVIVPAVSKLYFVHNGTTGGFGVQVKTAAGAGFIVPNGARAALYCNGTDVFQAADIFTTIPRTDASFVSGNLRVITAGLTIDLGPRANDIFVLYNNSANDVTLTQGAGVTMRLDGSLSSGNRTLLAYGKCTLHWISTTLVVVSGSVL